MNLKNGLKNKKILVISILTLICLGVIGVQNLNAKVFENNGRFISIKDNIPANSILLKDGTLFSPGGIDTKNKEVLPAQIYNFKTHKAEIVGKLNIPRQGSISVVLNDGRVLVYGGGSIQAELFDLKTKKFTLTDSFPTEIRTAYGAKLSPILLNDGRVFIISSGLPIIYNPNTEKFEIVGNVKQYDVNFYGMKRHINYTTINKYSNLIPILLKDGRVLLVGSSYDEKNNAEIYDPKVNSFIPTGQMKYSRSQFTATLLNDGRVVIVGGINKDWGYGISSAELFNPKTNSFSVTGTLKTKRYDHSAILLSNGKVLIVNGQYGHSTDLKDLKKAELFDPKTGTFKNIGLSWVSRPFSKLINISEHEALIPYGKKSEIYKY